MWSGEKFRKFSAVIYELEFVPGDPAIEIMPGFRV
jgi:hypothetical protein